MKYLLVLVVVMAAAWVLMGRSRGRGGTRRTGGNNQRAEHTASKAAEGAASTMVACAHCQVHLPRADTVADTQGRFYCDDAHRLAGPR